MVCDCVASVDTCGMCVQRHRMDACTNAARPHCVSCGTVGHASWDRSCPVFQRKCSEMDEQLEDNKLPYFPTGEAWTQVQEPPKVVYVVLPPPLSTHAPLSSRTVPRQYQSMLWWRGAGQNVTPQGPSMAPQQDRRQGPVPRGPQDSSFTSPIVNV